MTRRGLSILALVAALCTPALAQVTRPGGGVIPPTKLGGAGSGGGGGGGTVTSIIAGAGLSGGTITTTGTIAVNLTTTTCSAGQAVTAISALGVGTCSTFFNAAGAGLSATGSSVAVNLTTTSCSAGSAETATAANGTSTCGAVLVSGVATANGGLVASTSSGAFTVGLITSCGSNQVLAFVGSVWTCTTPNAGTVTSIIAGTGLSGGTITSSGTIAVNLTTTTCSAGQAETATAANGTSTCSAVVASIAGTGVTGGGITCSTTSGAATCWLGSGTGCPSNTVPVGGGGSGLWTCQAYDTGTVTSIATTAPITGGTITGTGTIGLSLTTTSCSAGSAETATAANGTSTCSAVVTSVANGTGISTSTSLGVATINVNLTTTSCTAGQAVTAISASGVGTCTTLISGTLNTVPVFATANTLGNSSITDDGTTFKINSTALTVTEASGAVVTGNRISGGERILAQSGVVYLNNSGGVDFGNGSNGVYTGHINDTGYQFLLTQFRNLEIDDGKGSGAGHTICTFTGGATEDTSCVGTFEATGLATLGGASLSGTLNMNSNGISAVAKLVLTSEVQATSAAPTLSGCGTGATATTGGAHGATVTTGTGTVTPCVITFGGTFTNTPTCVLEGEGSTKTHSYSVSTTAITLVSAAVSTRYHYICLDH